MADAVTKLVGGPRALNYFTHVSNAFGFIYFTVPAAASIRTIGSLNLAIAESLDTDFEIKNMAQLYNRQANILGMPKNEGMGVFNQMLDDPSVLKITFLRDPVDRFAALYRSIFSANTRKAGPRQTLFNHLGIPLEENLSMLDLAELLCEEDDLKSLTPQLRSQRQMAGYDLVDYNFIGRHETWQTDFATVSQDIFGQDVTQFDPVSSFNQDPEGANLQTTVDPETRVALEQAYADDYDMLEEVASLFPGGFAQDHE